MLRSCLLMLCLYAALFAGYYWWLSQMFDPPGVWIGAAVVALLVSGCIGAMINARVAYREWSLVASARHDLPWSDGRWTAVAGEIHPVQEPLQAPFSGAECVLCEYDVTSQTRVSAASRNDNSNPGSDFAGFLMNPCVVRSRMGDVRLLGFPNLVGFAERTCDSYDDARAARAFLTGNQFEDYSGLKLVTVVSAIKDAWSDDDGLVRKNLRLGKTLPETLFPPELAEDLAKLPPADSAGALPSDVHGAEGRAATDPVADEDSEDDEYDDLDEELEGDGKDATTLAAAIPLLKEKRVKVGEKVCAIGIYSGEKRGLVPGGLGADHFIKLIRGRIEDVERRSRSSVFSHLAGALIGLLVVNGAAYGVMMAKRYHPTEVERRQRDAFDAVAKGDVVRLAKHVSRGTGVNDLDSEGRTLLSAVREPTVARWLIDHGADVNAASKEGLTPLMDAARYGRTELVKLLIDAKADVNLRSPSYEMTALDLAERGGNADVAALLRAAGAKAERADAPQPR